MIKKILETYQEEVSHLTEKVNEWRLDEENSNNDIKSIQTAIELLQGNDSAIDALSAKLSSVISYNQRLKETINRYEEELRTVKQFRSHLMSILRKCCTHNWVYDGHNPHKNEDEYVCSICGDYSHG